MPDGYDQTLSGLLRKRASLAGEVETHRLALDNAGAALDAIDRAIFVFDPGFRICDLPERRNAPAFNGGELGIQRHLLDHLRRTAKPLRTLEAAAIVMEEKAWTRATRCCAPSYASGAAMR